VRKEKGRPKGRDHINGIEGFWSYAKNWLYPYLGEIYYRFNHRKHDLKPLLQKLLRKTTMSNIKPILVRLE
jgi:transposase